MTKNYRIKKVTDGHSTRYYPQHKRFGLFWYNLFVDEYRDGDWVFINSGFPMNRAKGKSARDAVINAMEAQK